MKLAFEDDFPGIPRIISNDAKVSPPPKQTPATIEPPKPRLQRKHNSWPLFIVGISWLRTKDDKGIGDTVKHALRYMGGDQFKWVMARLGVDCGCKSRQAWLNAKYRYEK